MGDVVDFDQTDNRTAPDQTEPTENDTTLETLLRSTMVEPDVEAFQIILAACGSQFLKPKGYKPTWLMVIAPSGAGKSMLINALNEIHWPDKEGELRRAVVPLDQLTPKSLMSGFERTKGIANQSLLSRIGSNAIVTFKEFTTILSMRTEARSEVMSHLREVHDGRTSKGTGMNLPRWSGRITIIAACTPEIDKSRYGFRVMGDRFMEVRMAFPDPAVVSRWLLRNGEPDVSRLAAHVRDAILTLQRRRPADLPEEFDDYLTGLSIFVAHARTGVIYDKAGREVAEVNPIESPTRLVQAIASVAITNATLAGRLRVCQDDIRLCKRLAVDTVPPERMKLIRGIPVEGCTTVDQLAEFTEFPELAFRRSLLALEALRIVEVDQTDVKFSAKFSAVATSVTSR